jgi:hypothetical protein
MTSTAPWHKVVGTIGADESNSMMFKCWESSIRCLTIPKTVASDSMLCKFTSLEIANELNKKIGNLVIYIPTKNGKYAKSIKKVKKENPMVEKKEVVEYLPDTSEDVGDLQIKIGFMILDDYNNRSISMHDLRKIFTSASIPTILEAFKWARNQDEDTLRVILLKHEKKRLKEGGL